MSTLIGIGAREAMPTLFDFDDFEDEATCPRITAVASPSDELRDDIDSSLMDWNDDEDETCFDVDRE